MTTSRLDELVCFAIYSAANSTAQTYRQVLAPWNLTYTQFLVLVVLTDRDRTVSELGRELGLDSGTLSPLLKRLESLGLVERRRSGEDERRVAIHLTPAGRELSGNAGAIPQRLADAAGLSAKELDQLRHTLGRLTAALHNAL